MLFGEGVGLSGWMSTHPPLLDRIRALEPSFTADKLDVLRHQWEISPPNGIKEDLAMGLSASSGDLPAAQAELRLVPPAVVAQVATPQSNDYSRAGQIVKQIPDSLYRAAHDRSAAPSLIFGLLFSESSKIRQQQFLELKARIGGEAAQHAVDYADRLQTLHPMLRLPLAELALPVMRRRPRPELEGFAEMIYALTHADGKVSLFEYCLGALVRRHVFEMLDPSRTHKVGNKRVSQLSKEVVSLLSVLAQAGHTDAIKAQHAFLAGIACLFPREAIAYMVPRDPIALLDSALNELDALQPESKSLLIEAMVVSISHDGCVSVAEAELLRTICAALHCPLPPMLEQVPQH